MSNFPCYDSIVQRSFKKAKDVVNCRYTMTRKRLRLFFAKLFLQTGSVFTEQTQFNTVACREYTLPREESTSQPKGWIQGDTKIGPVLEVTTSYLHGKHGVEIRIWSLNRDNTHSWVKISHESKEFVMNLSNNET